MSQTNEASLFVAITNSNLATVQLLLSTIGVTNNVRDPAGRTPLHQAILEASFDVVQYLLSEGVSLEERTTKGETVLHLAVLRGSVEIFKLVLDTLNIRNSKDGIEQKTQGETKAMKNSLHVESMMAKKKVAPLHLAVIYGQVELVRLLVEDYGANVNLSAETFSEGRRIETPALALALYLDRDVCRPIIRILLEGGAQILTLKTNVLDIAVSLGSDVLDLFSTYDSDGFSQAVRGFSLDRSVFDTPLNRAISMGREKMSLELLTYGAPSQMDFEVTVFVEPTSQNADFSQEARWCFRQPPLLLAAVSELPRVMQALLERGADPAVTVTETQAKQFMRYEYSDCRNALDVVLRKLAELRSWEGERRPSAHEPIENADETLQKKKVAILSLINEYEHVERKLVQANVTTSTGFIIPTTSSIKIEPAWLKPNVAFVTAARKRQQEEAKLMAENSNAFNLDTIKSVEEGHAALLTASRLNDLTTVKRLTLTHWGPDSEFPPLAIANKDKPESSAFFVAATSGNYGIAKLIICIAAVQYENPIEMQHSISELFPYGENIYSKLADDTIPIDKIKAVSDLLKNTITPLDMVIHCQLDQLSARKNDAELLKFDVQARELCPVTAKEWMGALEERIEATGFPFKHSTVKGKLQIGQTLERQDQSSPLLRAAREGHLRSVQFYETETPMNAYRQFAMMHTFDTRKKSIEKAREDFLKCVETWLNQRRELVIHCAIISGNIDTVNYLVSSHPELLEVRSADGWTPLMIAAIVHNAEAIRILLAAGADLFAQDLLGRNMLHLLLVDPSGLSYSDKKKEAIRSTLELLDNSTRQSLLSQGNSAYPGNLTPLAHWVYENCSFGWVPQGREEILNIILNCSDGSDLDIQDDSGLAPLHIAVKFSMDGLVGPLIKRNPKALFREGPGGMTPLDLAAEKHMQSMIDRRERGAQHGEPDFTTRPIVECLLGYFAKEYSKQSRANYPKSAYETWKICYKSAQENKAHFTRQLVTREYLEQTAKVSNTKRGKKQGRAKVGDELTLAIYRPGDLY